MVSHTYNIHNNEKSKPASSPTFLPPSQPFLMPTPHLSHILVENMINSSNIVLLWLKSLQELTQTSPTYHATLQEALQKIFITPSYRLNDAATQLDSIHVENLDIIFQKVRWDFLFKFLNKMGFQEQMISIVR